MIRFSKVLKTLLLTFKVHLLLSKTNLFYHNNFTIPGFYD